MLGSPDHAVLAGREVPHAVPLSEEVLLIADPEPMEDAVILSIETARLRRAMRALDPFDAWVLSARFGLDRDRLSIRDMASRLGCAHTTVLRMERRALDRLRAIYVEELAA